MREFCLPKELADRLKAAAVRGEIDIAKMYNMTSAERSAFFEQWVDKDTARKINGKFEEAMIAPQKTALRNWAKATFSGKGHSRVKTDVYDKIERLNELGVLNPKNQDAFLSDLVATSLGIGVSAQEAGIISEKSARLQELAKQETEFGTPTMEYFKVRKELDNYLDSLTPTSRLKVVTSVIGRGSMLFSLKSPLLNIESNTVQAFLTAAERRLGGVEVTKKNGKVKISGRMMGLNGDYSIRYMKFVNAVFKETGYDLTRMQTIKGEKKIRGETMTTAQGEGKVRAIGRVYEDIVFKKLMGAPDVAFASFHFTDSANLFSTKIAQSEGLQGEQAKTRALEIFKDATRIDPKTKIGQKVREQAIADAQYATYTNESWASELSLKIREVLNSITGDARLGDQWMPFVKTPANVIKVGLDYSGVLLPFETANNIKKTIQAIRRGEDIKTATLESFNGWALQAIRAGLGITLAHIISSLFDPDDYIGEYPVSQKEQELLRLENATTNSVRIGGKWVSLDYFGALGAPLVGMLSAKKYGGENIADRIFNYYTGVGKQALKLPGLEIAKDVYEKIDRGKYNSIKENMFELEKSLIDYARSRTIPAFLNDIAKSLDKFERQVEKKSLLEPVQAVVPFWRQQLPPKMDVFGRDIESEGLATMLFGSRVKTAKTDAVVKEITRLADSGNLPSITDYAKTSPRMKELRMQIGEDKFREAQKYLGTEFYDAVEKKIKSYTYKKANDEDKAKIITNIKGDLLEKTLKRYHYKKPKEKKMNVYRKKTGQIRIEGNQAVRRGRELDKRKSKAKGIYKGYL